MGKKKKSSSKNIEKKKRSYRRVIEEHVSKIEDNLKTGEMLESITHMKKEVAAAKSSLEKLEKIKEKRKKRGTKRES